MLLLNEGDIFIGFLWVIDFGVGLIFFIFMLYFFNFLYQKTILNYLNFGAHMHIYICSLIILLFFIFKINGSNTADVSLFLLWTYLISWYNFYSIYIAYAVSELNLLKDIYFYANSFEFFLINFLVFYGVVASIFLIFMVKKIFALKINKEIKLNAFFNNMNVFFFIKNQNFLVQQNTLAGIKIWQKHKN